MHLRVKFFSGGRRVQRPGDVVPREIVGAVAGVPGVGAAGPGQLVGEGGDEVVERPGHDGVVVGGDVEGDDADGVADPWEGSWGVGGTFTGRPDSDRRTDPGGLVGPLQLKGAEWGLLGAAIPLIPQGSGRCWTGGNVVNSLDVFAGSHV